MDKSNKLWVEAQLILIKQLKLQKENAEQNIYLNKLSLKNVNKSIVHEEKMLEDFLNNLGIDSITEEDYLK